MATTNFEQSSASPLDVAANPLKVKSLAFIEFAGSDPEHFDNVFKAVGFSKVAHNLQANAYYYQQNDCHFLLNQSSDTYEAAFARQHGLSACSIGLWVEDANVAFEEACRRGGVPFDASDANGHKSYSWPAIYGVGGSLVYFVDGTQKTSAILQLFKPLEQPELVKDTGFMFVDHMTNNVEEGQMGKWVDFYQNIFGFTKIQYFDIRGNKTGLTSFALKSPCRTFSIPINEASESKSQIAEYIRDYNGAGIQHIALATNNLLATLDQHENNGIATLDIGEDYYEEAFQRVPQVTEDKAHIQRHQVLIDGDADGYLLQIFTKNLFGPIFFEFIQRKNHHAFGEGNFGALFKSIERDQERRGVL